MTHFANSFPLSLSAISPIELIIVVVVVAAAVAVTVLLMRKIGKGSVTQAQAEAQRITEQAQKDAEVSRKQVELEGRNELIALRETFERESNETRNELKDIERRLGKREDNLDRTLDVLDTKEKQLSTHADELNARQQKLTEREGELDGIIEEQRQRLMQVASLSEAEAREILLEQLRGELQHEAAEIIQREVSKAEDEAREQSRKITIQAIQRYAAEHTSTSTVSVIDIPSDDMKGRVIGREGRNIRAFEQSTGVDVIVDDTPGVVVVSCFDPIRRAVASESLSRLIEDGRIHPSRIEEIVSQVRTDIDERIVRYGKDASIETNIRGLHGKVSEMMGRLKFRTSYGQNVLRHSVEVAFLCQVIADELGLDGTIARRCGYLHDIGKALDHEVEGGHPAIGMEYCRRYNEKEEVLNAIGAHHGDIEVTTPYTPIVAAADAISGARPGARRETLERYVQRLQQLEDIARGFNGVDEAYAIQAGREVRVIVDAKRVNDSESTGIARDIAKRVEEEMTYPGEVRVTVLREVRTVEYAR